MRQNLTHRLFRMPIKLRTRKKTSSSSGGKPRKKNPVKKMVPKAGLTPHTEYRLLFSHRAVPRSSCSTRILQSFPAIPSQWLVSWTSNRRVSVAKSGRCPWKQLQRLSDIRPLTWRSSSQERFLVCAKGKVAWYPPECAIEGYVESKALGSIPVSHVKSTSSTSPL